MRLLRPVILFTLLFLLVSSVVLAQTDAAPAPESDAAASDAEASQPQPEPEPAVKSWAGTVECPRSGGMMPT